MAFSSKFLRCRGTSLIMLSASLLTACTGGTSSQDTSPAWGGSEVVLQVRMYDAAAGPEELFGALPLLSVYGDGRALVLSETPLGERPELLTHSLTPDEVTKVLELMQEAGVGVQPSVQDDLMVADAATTIFTLNDGDRIRSTSMYALEESVNVPPGPVGAPPPVPESHLRLKELLDQLRDLPSLLGRELDGSRYNPSDIAALARVQEGDPSAALEWEDSPLNEGADLLGGKCAVLQGESAAKALQVLEKRPTPLWTSDGALYSVLLRPLLPHEHSCTDIVRK